MEAHGIRAAERRWIQIGFRIGGVKIPKGIRRTLRKVLTKDKRILSFRKTPQNELYGYELLLFKSDGHKFELTTIYLCGNGEYIEKRVNISKKDVYRLHEMLSRRVQMDVFDADSPGVFEECDEKR